MSVKLTRASHATAVALASVLALSLPAPASAGGSPADAQSSSPPNDRIVIDVETVNGSGCPAGTATVKVSPDNTEFRITYRKYRAEVGSGADPTDLRKNCQISLEIHIPQGFTFAIAEAEYRGFLHLERGASALERASYYFMGESDTAHVDHPFTGPFHGTWETTDSTPVAELVFAPCGVTRNLNINTELRVNSGTSNPAAHSFMTMGSTEGSIDTIYHFHWKQC